MLIKVFHTNYFILPLLISVEFVALTNIGVTKRNIS